MDDGETILCSKRGMRVDGICLSAAVGAKHRSREMGPSVQADRPLDLIPSGAALPLEATPSPPSTISDAFTMSDPPATPITPRPDTASSRGAEASSARPSQFAHLSVTRFSDLIRNIDSASAGPKRRRTEAPSVSSIGASRQAGKPLGIADWAKAKADLKLERKGVGEPLRTRAGVKGKATSSSQSPASTSSSYAPFSKARLLERIATFSLSTYNVRVSIAFKTSEAMTSEQGQQAVASLGRWLEPIGPALNGWIHLPPRSTTQSAETGAKNKLHCPTCSASVITADQIEDLELLFRQVQSLQTGHQAWCPWTKRSCHPSLYSLQGVEEGFVGRLSRTKARRVFRELAGSIKIGADVPVVRPAGFSEEESEALQAALDTPGLAIRSAMTAGSSDEVSPPPSVPAIILALFGWLPIDHDPSAASSSSTSTAKRPRSSLSSAKVLQCKSCSRKLTAGSVNRSTSIDPVREHRRFCPWVQADVQADTYLQPLKSILGIATASAGADGDQEMQLQGDGSAMLKAFSDARQPPHSSAITKPSHPGWPINLRALLPSPGTALQEVSSGLYASVATISSTASVASLDEGPDGPDASLDLSTQSARTGTVKRKRTSEILREARSLLFGTGGGSGVVHRVS